MVDYTVTAANVAASSNATTVNGTAGATITQGQAVYKSSTDGEWYLLDCDDSTKIGTQGNIGIALNGASDGQPLRVCTYDPSFTPGITMVVGTAVVGSGTAGGLAPASDLAQNDYHIMLIHPKTTALGYLSPILSTNAIA